MKVYHGTSWTAWQHRKHTPLYWTTIYNTARTYAKVKAVRDGSNRYLVIEANIPKEHLTIDTYAPLSEEKQYKLTKKLPKIPKFKISGPYLLKFDDARDEMNVRIMADTMYGERI